jgi:hypothetical protein
MLDNYTYAQMVSWFSSPHTQALLSQLKSGNRIWM